jgi:putative solute:sodium symporter small subunit
MIRSMPDDAAFTPPCFRCALLKAGLLAVWVLVSFGMCFFARDLHWMVFGWPFNYWMAAQGAVLVFIGIVVAYAWGMNRIERDERAEQGASEAAAGKGAADV